MKTLTRLFIISALIITSSTLFAFSANNTGNESNDPKGSVNENVYSEVDYEMATKAIKTIKKSTMALENVMQDPKNSIPPSIISQSEGIVIFPRALKIALGTAGGQAARGIAMIRQEDGSWSNPFFVSLGEASVGCQIGVQKSDIVLLFNNRNDIMAIDEADIMLGGGIGVAAGPASREASAATVVKFDADVYSYSNSNGLFAGVSFNGGILSNNSKFNESLYGYTDVSTDNIFNEIEAPYNDQVNDLIETLNFFGE